jgi:ankyrin repeat protein
MSEQRPTKKRKIESKCLKHFWTAIIEGKLIDVRKYLDAEIRKARQEDDTNIEADGKLLVDDNYVYAVNCRNQNIKSVSSIPEQKDSLRVNLVGDETPLHIACLLGHIEIVSYLLQQPHIEIDAINKDGSTSLHSACIGSYISKEGQSGVFNTNVVTLLLEKGINIRLQNKNGGTALHTASYFGQIDIAKLILGKDIGILEVTNIIDGMTPLFAALMGARNEPQDNEAMVKFLLDQGANIDAQTIRKTTPLNFTAKLIYEESKNDLISVVKLLLRRGANKAIVDKDGNSFFHYYASIKDIWIAEDYLLFNKMDDIRCLKVKNSVEKTPLQLATQSRLHDKVQLFEQYLIMLDKDPTDVVILFPLNDKRTKKNFYRKDDDIVSAIKCSNIERVRTLLSQTYCATAVGTYESKPPLLHIATKYGSTDIIQLLLDGGADINCKNKSNQTALTIATCVSYENSIHTVSFLLEQGADIYTTLLYLASDKMWYMQNHEIPTINFLLNHKQVDDTLIATDDQGRTIMDIACANFKFSFLKLLSEKGGKMNQLEANVRAVAANPAEIILLKFLLAEHNVDRSTILSKDTYGDTALHVACNNKIASLLLDVAGFDSLKITNTKGQTPLDKAEERLRSHDYIRNWERETDMELVTFYKKCLHKLIEDHYVPTHIPNDSSNDLNDTTTASTAISSLHVPVRPSSVSRSFEICPDAVLSEHEEDNFRLHSAVKFGYMRFVEREIQNANNTKDGDEISNNNIMRRINKVDYMGRTALDLAALTGQLDLVKRLEDAGGEFHYKNGPRMVAIANQRSKDVVEYLQEVRKIV